MPRIIRNAMILLAFLGLPSCGAIHLGSGALNEQEPTTPLVASGRFTGLSGIDVSGSASIHQNGIGSYTLFLGGITLPSESAMQVIVRADGGVLVQLGLRATVGSQNYSFTTQTTPVIWQRVDIRSTRNNQDYAQALLDSSSL